jgi:hypothetical protein
MDLLHEIFSGFDLLIQHNVVSVLLSKEDYDSIIGTYFPMKMWLDFSFFRESLPSDLRFNVVSASDYLSEHFDSSQKEVPFLPSHFQLFTQYLKSNNSDIINVDEEKTTLKFHGNLRSAFPKNSVDLFIPVGIVKINWFNTYTINNLDLQSILKWLVKPFPIRKPPNLTSKFRLLLVYRFYNLIDIIGYYNPETNSQREKFGGKTYFEMREYYRKQFNSYFRIDFMKGVDTVLFFNDYIIQNVPEEYMYYDADNNFVILYNPGDLYNILYNEHFKEKERARIVRENESDLYQRTNVISSFLEPSY